MSNANGHGWKPRKPEPYTCVDGSMVLVKRPGPAFTIRAGRIARTYSKFSEPDSDHPLARMTDEEQESLVNFARELLVAMLVSPKLVLNPDPENNEIGPDDTGPDFWNLFHYGMGGLFNVKVPIGDTEVEVKDLETFREESGVPGHGLDSPHVPSDAQRVTGDSGLGDSAGA